MGSSYLPAGVKVNCTYMTVTAPNELGISRSKVTVFKGSPRAALLNIDDKKISASFECKSPAKFWGGLASLCLGIAVGILVAAAVVGTGGAALVVVLAVAAVAASTSVVSLGIGVYKQSHACDCTLKSQWVKQHSTVNINGAKAILLQSHLICVNKGIVQPFLNGALAASAAAKIAHNNDMEIVDQMVSEFAIGAVSIAGTLGDPTAIVLTSGLSVYEYADEYDVEEGGTVEEDAKTAGKDSFRDNIEVGGAPTVGIAAHDAIKEVTEYNEKMIPELMSQGASLDKAMELQAAFGKGGADVAKGAGKGIGASLGAGFAAAAVNFGIAQWAKADKKGHIHNVLSTLNSSTISDSKNNIGILANKP